MAAPTGLKSILFRIAPVADVLLAPVIFLSAVVLRCVRSANILRMPVSKRIFHAVRLWPVLDHYYEPLFHPRHRGLGKPGTRELPGIALRGEAQLALLEEFPHSDRLADLAPTPTGRRDQFHFGNGAFEAGDAECLYHVIRHFRPARIIEVGCGYSTLLAQRAIGDERGDDAAYSCAQVCVEPYENDWLESLPLRVIRARVQDLPLEEFTRLQANDLLFIDSSHVIRPQGDVTFLYLDVLPRLAPGVIVHIHDIFTPRDYPDAWVFDQVRMWNEQYLLEAFLTQNPEWEVLLALDHLCTQHRQALQAVCPHLRDDSLPASFYIRRLSAPSASK